MPITANRPAGSNHANRSNDCISDLHGPHQLAQTLMISGLPRNSASLFAGPFSPCRAASRNTSPICASAGVFPNAACVPPKQHNNSIANENKRISMLGLA